jgi:transposase
MPLAQSSPGSVIREEQMSHEIALLRRHRYGKISEGLDAYQLSLLQELIDEDTSAVEMELEKISLKDRPKADKQQAKRQPLPPQLPRSEIRHEPDSTASDPLYRLWPLLVE